MNYLLRLAAWTTAAALAMFATYAWLPDWIKAVGVFVGFLSIIQVLSIKGVKPSMQDGLLLATFCLIVVLSYVLLAFACRILPDLNQCSLRAKTALIIADVFFVGAPILAEYLVLRIPMLFRLWMNR